MMLNCSHIPLVEFIYGFQEPVEPDRLQKIIYNIHFKGLKCIIFISRCDNDMRRVFQGVKEIKPFQFWQLYIQKNQVNLLLLKEFHSKYRVAEYRSQFKEWHLFYVVRQDFCGQRLIFYYNATISQHNYSDLCTRLL